MSNPIDMITEPVKEEMERRMRNSFYVSLVIAFIGYNWRAILYLCYLEEKWDVRDRVKWLQDYVYKDSGYFWPLVGLPILSALAVTILVPLVTDLLEDVTVWSKMWQSNRHKDIETRKRDVAKKIIALEALIKQREAEIAAKDATINSEMSQVYLLLNRLLPVNEQLRMNLKGLKVGKPINISAGQDDLEAFGLAEKQPDGTWKVTGRGVRLSSTIQ